MRSLGVTDRYTTSYIGREIKCSYLVNKLVSAVGVNNDLDNSISGCFCKLHILSSELLAVAMIFVHVYISITSHLIMPSIAIWQSRHLMQVWTAVSPMKQLPVSATATACS